MLGAHLEHFFVKPERCLLTSLLFLPNLGFPEILLILVLALLLFGPKKLPEIGRSLGKSFREFKRGTSGFLENLDKAPEDGETKTEPLPRPDAKVAATAVSEPPDEEPELVIKVDQPSAPES